MAQQAGGNGSSGGGSSGSGSSGGAPTPEDLYNAMAMFQQLLGQQNQAQLAANRAPGPVVAGGRPVGRALIVPQQGIRPPAAPAPLGQFLLPQGRR